MTTAQASERQIKYLDDLLKTREIPEVITTLYLSQKATLDSKKASALITTCLQFPKLAVVKEEEVAPAPHLDVEAHNRLLAELNGALATIPQSKYAIPVSELMTDFLKDKVHGDLVFLEVRTYMDHLYIKKLFGSVGAFTRVRTNVEDAIAFVRIIQRDPYKYARNFAEHYQCCGKCGAELTDPISREVMLGPWCRKAFGK